jgi:hypothetical protein
MMSPTPLLIRHWARDRHHGGVGQIGETQNQLIHFSFGPSLKADFQGSRVISDGGLLLVRELD